MNNILIRMAILDDLPTLLEYEQGIITAERPFDSTLAPDPISYYDIKAMILNPDVAVVVAELEQKVISCGYALEKEANPFFNHTSYAYLGFMYTHPEYRGMGVNGRIMEALKEWCISKGLTEIRLTVYPGNIPAIKAYEKIGFKKHLIEMRLE